MCALQHQITELLDIWPRSTTPSSAVTRPRSGTVTLTDPPIVCYCNLSRTSRPAAFDHWHSFERGNAAVREINVFTFSASYICLITPGGLKTADIERSLNSRSVGFFFF